MVVICSTVTYYFIRFLTNNRHLCVTYCWLLSSTTSTISYYHRYSYYYEISSHLTDNILLDLLLSCIPQLTASEHWGCGRTKTQDHSTSSKQTWPNSEECECSKINDCEYFYCVRKRTKLDTAVVKSSCSNVFDGC